MTPFSFLHMIPAYIRQRYIREKKQINEFMITICVDWHCDNDKYVLAVLIEVLTSWREVMSTCEGDLILKTAKCANQSSRSSEFSNVWPPIRARQNSQQGKIAQWQPSNKLFFCSYIHANLDDSSSDIWESWQWEYRFDSTAQRTKTSNKGEIDHLPVHGIYGNEYQWDVS